MKHVSFPLYTFIKSGPDSIIDGMTIGSIVNFILFFLVLFLMYFIVRRVSRTGDKNLFSKNMRIVEKVPMGFDSSILIMELQGIYYIIYTDKHGATLLDKREDLNLKPQQEPVAFKSILSKWVAKRDIEQDESDDK